MLGIVKKATISILILLALLIGGRTIYKLYKAPTTETQPNEKERDWGDIHQDFKNNPELIEEWEKENEEEIKTIDKVIQNITDGQELRKEHYQEIKSLQTKYPNYKN
ncbi:10689_t:CDS:2 [Entrophospora sp. SA101]|nr:10689_t:CDS:2 [Entrophospora sp. SA101]